MAHINQGDDAEADGRKRSGSPIVWESWLNPCVRRTKARVDDYESLPSTKPPDDGWNPSSEKKHALLYSIGGLPKPKPNVCTLDPPEDESIKTLLVRGFSSKINEDVIRDHFVTYGEIESIIFYWRASAAVTYTSREGAVKATQQLSRWMTIKGERVKLEWKLRPDLVRQPDDQTFSNQQQRIGVDCYQSPPRTTPVIPLPGWNQESERHALVCDFPILGWCTLGAKCRFRSEMPSQNINFCSIGGLAKPKPNVCTLDPPEDESIKTLLVRGFSSKINEDVIRDHFVTYGEIESIIFYWRASAAVTYTSREGAVKATQQLSRWMTIKGERVKLEWKLRPDLVRQPDDQTFSNQQQRIGVDCYQSPPRTTPVIPLPGWNPESERRHALVCGFPFQDPQRIGAEVGGSSTSENNGASSSYQMSPHQPYED